jgi:hypothetical protein
MNNSLLPEIRIAFDKLKHSTNPFTATFAWIGMFLNAILVWTLFMSRKRATRRRSFSQGQIHLLFLAASDILVGATYAAGSVWFLLLSEASLNASFVLHFKIWYCVLIIVIFVNRWLTMFIAAKRAQGVFSVAQGLKVMKKTPKENAIETFGFGILAAIVQALGICGVFWTTYFEDNKRSYSIVSASYFILLTIVVTIFTAFIIYKVRQNVLKSPLAICPDATLVIEYQKLVTGVSIVYCITNFVFLAVFGLNLISNGLNQMLKSSMSVIVNFNSSVNIFVYLFFSPNFRKTLWGLLCSVQERGPHNSFYQRAPYAGACDSSDMLKL